MDFSFYTCASHNLYILITNPVEGVFRFRKRYIKYCIISFLVSFSIVILSYFSAIFGLSVNIVLKKPLVTCFIRNFYKDDVDINQFRTGSAYSIFILVILMFVFNFYLNFRILRTLKKKPKSIKSFVIKNIMLGTIYELLYFPTLILYFTSFNVRISSNTQLSWLSYISAILNITPDFFLVLSRIIFKQAGFFCFFVTKI